MILARLFVINEIHRWLRSRTCRSGGTRKRQLRVEYHRSRSSILGRTKPESTVRYLGIEVDDALEMAEQTEV